jgi:hypothetical protein
MKIFRNVFIALLLLAVFMPAVSFAAADTSTCGSLVTSDRGLGAVVDCLVVLFNYAVYIIMSAAVVYIVYGAFLMISNEEKRENGKQIIYHGIIGLFVMISIWGFVNILDNTFRLSDATSSNVIPASLITPR